jgi:small-conductance mechanosensitive channel
MTGILEISIYGNLLRSWLALIGVVTVVTLSVAVARRLVMQRFTARPPSPGATRTLFIEGLQKLRLPVVLIMALYGASRPLIFPERVDSLLHGLAVLAVFVQVASWADLAARFLLARYLRTTSEGDGRATTVTVLGILARLTLLTILLLVTLENLGINITALVAGLGIGGIAIALASQTVLADLFASVSIVFDKPFVVGDFIVVDTFMGVVEHVGLKTTRVRSLAGEQIVLPNADLLKSRIRNYKRMYERRVVFSVGVVPDTPHAALTAIPGLIRTIVEAQPQTRFERAHLAAYTESAILFEVVYNIPTADHKVYMDLQQAIYLGIDEHFRKEGIMIRAANTQHISA